MKYSSEASSAMFSEQVQTVIELFEQWNDCERVVTLYALLKQIPFTCNKFIQYAVEANLAQAYNTMEHIQILEANANCAKFLTNLSETYKNFKCNDVQLNKDSIFYESDRNLHKTAEKYYDKKEDILNEILQHMPVLRPGNEEAKVAYLEIIPMAVDDVVRGCVNTSLVQQIFSFLLIHPAFSTDDRRSLSKFLRHLENHIISKEANFLIYPNGSSPTNEQPHSSSSSWQAIAPPQNKSNETISWGSSHHLTTPNFVDETKEYCKTVGSLIDFPTNGQVASPNLGGCIFDSSADDHHESFSKNGTEIEFDCEDTDKSNTQIGFDTLAHLNEFLTVPGVIDNIALKTRRSNSLTTTGSTPNACSSSAQNLANISQKPRSFSLSMVSPRSSLTSSGSDTRLDDFKPKYTKFSMHNIGMGNIGQWLKSLRLHKYIWLFSNITYDQMMDITEEYLQNLNVTKGARHKLVLCIQKLKERHAVLVQIEKDLLASKMPISSALDDLTNIVLSPIKPVDTFNKKDVGGQFLKVLSLVSTMMTTKPIVPQDEEIVNTLLWILEKAVHNEAFVAHTNQLKEYRFKVSRIKAHFPQKGHFGGKNSSSNNGNITRTRSLSQYNNQTEQQMKVQNHFHRRTLTNSVPFIGPPKPLLSLITSPVWPDNLFLNQNRLQCTNRNLICPPGINTGNSIVRSSGDVSVKTMKTTNDRPSVDGQKKITILTRNTQPTLTQSLNSNSDDNHLVSQIQFGSFSNIFFADPDIFKSNQLPTKRTTSLTMPDKKTMDEQPRTMQTQSEPNLSKPSYSQITASGIGMSNIPAWLKSLRLHKYTWIFTNLTYDQLLNITEEYLTKLNVTKGARDKLLICIGKLRDRFTLLCEIEQELQQTNGQSLNNALDELLKIVVTPMKPIQLHDKTDIGTQFLKVLNLVFVFMTGKSEPDSVSTAKIGQILERAVNSEAFVAHVNQVLKMKARFS